MTAPNRFEPIIDDEGKPTRRMAEWMEGLQAPDIPDIPEPSTEVPEHTHDFDGLNVVAYNATDDAGNGSVEDDVNNTDFTSQTGDTFIDLAVNDYLLIEHKQVAYAYVGPREVSIGVGGSYVTAADDYTPTGTNDHTLLINRNSADQHDMASITGLLADQTRQDDALTVHINNTDPHPNLDHNTVRNRDVADTHPMSAITGLLADQTRQDDALSAHITDPGDPHSVYRLKQPAAGFWGAPSNMTISGVDRTVINWPNVGTINAIWTLDPVAGTIEVPQDGVYRLIAWIIGDQGNNTKEETMRLGVDIDGVKGFLDVFDVATDKTDDRSFSVSLTRAFTQGQVVSLFMNATANMGTFNFTNGTFELERLADTGGGGGIAVETDDIILMNLSI